MKALCPNNPSHKRFATTAHVMESWEVDENGDYLKTLETLQVDNGPDIENHWTCLECGSEAIVRN